MKHIIIGTAGHIDHGKTMLVKALTGRDTDRWEEERRRGITIDLGFTYFDLPNGSRAGIIDVPGHEKFIHNMAAGVVGMDLVLLVIAADEGIMPQTREHMDILQLLGIEKSLIVLNKCDLVDSEWLELMETEIREELDGTFLQKAPILKVSALTGAGLDQLTEMIVQMTNEEVVPKDVHTIPRLPVDRVFTLTGFGTVVTGTLLTGTLEREDVLCLYPLGKTCRIRGIQVHGEEQTSCSAGQRVALNLSNVKKEEIKRGCVLALPESMKNTDLLDVKLQMLTSSKRVLKNHARLHLFTGTSEILCRAVLLDQEQLEPGQSGYAQLRLEEPLAVRRGDKFILRFYSPLETIGGGVILEANPGRKKRFQPAVMEQLRRKESAAAEDVIEMQVKSYPDMLITIAQLAKLTAMSPEEVTRAAETLAEQGLVHVLPMRKDTYVWHAASRRERAHVLGAALRAYEARYPYRHGMKKAEVQTLYFKKIKPNVFDYMIELLEKQNQVHRAGEFLCTADFSVRKDEQYERVSGFLLTTFAEAKYDFVRYAEISCPDTSQSVQDDILNLLWEDGEIVKISDEIYTLHRYIKHAEDVIVKELKENHIITIRQLRDLLQTSRKSAKLMLEYMDGVKVTKKTGAETEREAYKAE